MLQVHVEQKMSSILFDQRTGSKQPFSSAATAPCHFFGGGIFLTDQVVPSASTDRTGSRSGAFREPGWKNNSRSSSLFVWHGHGLGLRNRMALKEGSAKRSPPAFKQGQFHTASGLKKVSRASSSEAVRSETENSGLGDQISLNKS